MSKRNNPAVDFHLRLAQACEDSRTIPEYGHGRQVVVAKKLKVSQEAVRKWFTGETRPRIDKMRELAQFLDVDEAWLSLGVQPEMDRAEKRIHTLRSEGAVYAMFGIISMNGGHCAFPSSNDPRKGFVDFYAIHRGTQFAVHVTVGREVTKNNYEFILPREYKDVHCIGVVHHTWTTLDTLDLTMRMVEKHKEKKGGQYFIRAHKSGHQYATGDDLWPADLQLGDFR